MKQIKLSEITLKLESGGRPKGGSDADGSIPSLGGEHINRDGGFNLKSIKFIPEAFYHSLTSGKINKGDILIVKDGATTGKVSFVTNDFPFEKAAVNEHVFILRLNEKLAHPKFIFHLLYSAQGQKQILKDFRGATVGGISRDFIKKVEIPLPPLAEQIHIAQVLDQADRLRQQDRQLLAHYDQLVQAVFMDMFGDPVRNERGWELKSFGSLGDARLGKMLDARKQTGTMLFPYLGNSNVQWGRFKTENLLQMDFSEKDRKEFSLRPGDLLICEGGEVGRTAIWNSEKTNVYFQKALHRVRLKSGVATPEYIQHLMWRFAHGDGFKDVVNVATIPHLTGEKLRGLKIPVPPFELQFKFSEIIGAIEAQKAATQQLQAQSEALFNSLLQQAFRGELGLPKPAGKAAAGQLSLVL